MLEVDRRGASLITSRQIDLQACAWNLRVQGAPGLGPLHVVDRGLPGLGQREEVAVQLAPARERARGGARCRGDGQQQQREEKARVNFFLD